MLLSPIFTAHYQGQLLGRNWTPFHFVYGGITLFAGPFQATLTVFRKSVIAAAKHHISRRIQFGLFPFRSPLLGKSLLISLPRGTKMLQFPRFDLRCRSALKCKILIRKSRDHRIRAPTPSLSQLVTSFISPQA